ncbi:DUF6286 domain-containing Asp23/Gls24 family envelope stress response protein [Streptomyces sp. NPDC002886]|uniref:DUF6286 domain-containing Asp23/Gls24 family envelope stress response protein n=1 Tax=Streptomyces sp. NPDC002886 TaxID=3364667 RepID=UPI0036C62667
MTARERGTTTVADRVVRKIAEQAARESTTALSGRVTKGSASVRGQSANVGLNIVLAYRGSAGDATQAVQDHVAARTSHLTGFRLASPRISVRDLAATARGVPAVAEDVPTAFTPGRSCRRGWSERRLPVAVLAALALGGCAALLQDVAAVHLQARRPAQWRVHVAGWLAHHGPATTPVWAAVVLAVGGLWLVALALTPGRRGDLTMSTPDADVRAVISRHSASRLLRAALAQTPGITEPRVRVRRRRLTVRAHFDHEDKARARHTVSEAVAAVVRETGLATPLRTRIRLHPASSRYAAPAPVMEGEPGASHP